jgi:protein ImuB
VIVCLLIPRFELLVAVAGRDELLREALALSPEPDREQVVGEVSGAAEALGIYMGMRLSEALARSPDLRLVAADPERAAATWEAVCGALEGIGAAVESRRAGEAYFEADGLRRLYGGSVEGVIARARKALRALAMPARLGAAPSRFCAFAAATCARPRVAKIVPAGAMRPFLAQLPVAMLRSRSDVAALAGSRVADLPSLLERLGIRTLGELAALPSRAVAERFGHPGLLALDLSRGRDTPLEPRRPFEPVVERLDLPEAASGQQLERALELLIARVLARRERRGRSLRGLAVSARFVAGGTWRTAVTLRHASADPARIRLALAQKLAELPAPSESLALEVEAFGPPAHDQGRLLDEAEAVRRARLGEAVRQVRQAAGADAALRVLDVDPDSRIPERRAVLAPFPDAS